MQKKVFLGGTCNNSQWREALIPMLTIAFFNPVVPDWTEAAYQQELQERENSEFCLYVITPAMTGVYSIAEAVDDSNKRPTKTVFCYIDMIEDGNKTFDTHQLKSLKNTARLIEGNGGKAFTSLEDVAAYLNQA